MDLIIKAREVTVNITVQGFLKVVSANEKEIRFYISGEDNIKEASEQLSNHNIWHNPYPHYLGIPFTAGSLELSSIYNTDTYYERSFNCDQSGSQNQSTYQ